MTFVSSALVKMNDLLTLKKKKKQIHFHLSLLSFLVIEVSFALSFYLL